MEKLLLIGLAAILGLAVQVAEANCPWLQNDPTDQIGASRTQTPQKVLKSIRLVKTGELFRLGHVYDETKIDPPPFGRVFDQAIFPFDFPEVPSQSFNEGVLNASIGQVATQFDALGHAGHDTLGYYNCIPQSELEGNGLPPIKRLEKLGVEHVNPFFTRAILLDFVNHSSAPKMVVGEKTLLVDSYVISLADVREVMRNQRVRRPGKGDVVLFYTGWDSLFGVDNDRHFNAPGPGIEVAQWLASRNVAMMGSDTQASEAVIDGTSTELVQDPDYFGPEIGFVSNAVHLILITQNGIHMMEWMRLEHLAEALLEDHDRKPSSASRGGLNRRSSPYEFLFVFTPLPIKGLAGSPASPLAIR